MTANLDNIKLDCWNVWSWLTTEFCDLHAVADQHRKPTSRQSLVACKWQKVPWSGQKCMFAYRWQQMMHTDTYICRVQTEQKFQIYIKWHFHSCCCRKMSRFDLQYYTQQNSDKWFHSLKLKLPLVHTCSQNTCIYTWTVEGTTLWTTQFTDTVSHYTIMKHKDRLNLLK